MVITDELRAACAWVANRATHVRIVESAVGSYALGLADLIAHIEPTAVRPVGSGGQPEYEAAFWLTLDAINFGSGWFPTLRKRHAKTGYRTIEAGVRRRFEESGPWTPRELTELDRDELAAWLDQDPEHELIGLFVASLRDLGARVAPAGSFAAVVRDADGSALKLVSTLARWDCYTDVSTYDGRAVPFLKRAQLAAADLDRAGVGEFTDLPRLTMFADNLVPHVLRLDGVLSFAPELVARIEREQLIPHGSREEIEIRACAVQAVELIVTAARRARLQTTAAQIDELLWNRGQGAQYKAVPRHRSRGTVY